MYINIHDIYHNMYKCLLHTTCLAQDSRSTNINRSCISLKGQPIHFSCAHKNNHKPNKWSKNTTNTTQSIPFFSHNLNLHQSSRVLEHHVLLSAPLCSTKPWIEKPIWAFSIWGLLSLGSTSKDSSAQCGPLIASTGGCEWYVLI